MAEKPEKKEVTTSANAPAVTFTNEQIALINTMMAEREKSLRDSMARPDSPNSPISLYNIRDPKEIKTVQVSRFDSKWVIGFKDLQNDPYKKFPKYLRYGIEPIRKLNNEPYVTLLLSSDGKSVVEKEVLLLDYMQNRDKVNVDVIKVRVQEKINDHGILGGGGNFAVSIDEKGKPESRPTILAQSKSEERFFTVQLDGFSETTELSTDFLG